jgi:hypothetical protein
VDLPMGGRRPGTVDDFSSYAHDDPFRAFWRNGQIAAPESAPQLDAERS